MVFDKKLKVMLDEHKSRGGELEALLAKLIAKNPEKVKDAQALLNACTLYYRHVGAVWVLEGILKGKNYDWNTTKATAGDGEEGKSESG